MSTIRDEISVNHKLDLFDEMGISAKNQEIIRRYTSGEKTTQIAPDYGLTAGSVGDIVRRFSRSADKYLKRKEIAKRPDFVKHLYEVPLNCRSRKIIELFHQGHSYQKIATECSMSVSSVRHCITVYIRDYLDFEAYLAKKANFKRIGKYLKHLREERGMTIEDFGERFDLLPRVVMHYESGKVSGMRGDTMQDICAFYGILGPELWDPPEF